MGDRSTNMQTTRCLIGLAICCFIQAIAGPLPAGTLRELYADSCNLQLSVNSTGPFRAGSAITLTWNIADGADTAEMKPYVHIGDPKTGWRARVLSRISEQHLYEATIPVPAHAPDGAELTLNVSYTRMNNEDTRKDDRCLPDQHAAIAKCCGHWSIVSFKVSNPKAPTSACCKCGLGLLGSSACTHSVVGTGSLADVCSEFCSKTKCSALAACPTVKQGCKGSTTCPPGMTGESSTCYEISGGGGRGPYWHKCLPTKGWDKTRCSGFLAPGPQGSKPWTDCMAAWQYPMQ